MTLPAGPTLKKAKAHRNPLLTPLPQLRAHKDALDGKLSDLPQFQQMRRLMQAKSQEVVDLRKRLARYEPDACPSAD